MVVIPQIFLIIILIGFLAYLDWMIRIAWKRQWRKFAIFAAIPVMLTIVLVLWVLRFRFGNGQYW